MKTNKVSLDGLNYSTSEINRNMIIRVTSCDNYDGEKIHKAVGVSGLVELIGIPLANAYLDRAFKSIDDKCICKARRGLKICFYFK